MEFFNLFYVLNNIIKFSSSINAVPNSFNNCNYKKKRIKKYI